tara:strand:+ start:1545 stop:2411 length:867 start_codon:yes stop_codon:yes gene_type:complete
MAIPFYNQGDQDIYAGGNHFIPQEQFRLNYTPSTQLANTIGNTGGVTSTDAATPYIFPPQGGGGAGDISGTQVTYKRPLGLSPGALGGKLPGVGNWAKRTFGELEDLYSSLPLPSNLLRKGIMKWRENKEIKKQEKAAADQVAADQAAAQAITGAEAAGQRRAGKGGSHMSRSRDQGGLGISASQAQAVSDANRDAGMSGWGLAEGGRIGYANGEFVDEDVNIQGPGFDVNENIMMASDDNNTMALENLYAKYIEAGFPPEQAQAMAMQELQQMLAESGQDQGIASLV